MRKNIIDFVWLLASNLVVFVSGLIVIKLLAVSLGTAGYGFYSLCAATAAILSLLFYGPLDQAILRFWPDPGFPNCAIESAAKLFHLGYFLGLALLTGLLFMLPLGEYQRYGDILILAVIIAFPKGCLTSLVSLSNAQRDRKTVFFLNSIENAAKILLLVVFLENLSPVSAVFYLSFASAVAVGFFFFRGKSSSNSAQITIKRVVYAQPSTLNARVRIRLYMRSFMGIGVLSAIATYFDRWAIDANLTAEDVGIYAGIAQIAVVPLIGFSTIVTQFLSPLVFSASGTNIKLERVYAFLASCYLIYVVAVYLLSYELVELFLSPEFLIAHEMLPFLALGYSFFYFSQALFLQFQKAETTNLINYAWIFRVIVMCIVSLFLVNVLGIWGVAFAVFVSCLAFLVAVIYLYRSVVVGKI